MAKVRDTDSEALKARIRELTEECRRLRFELAESTKQRLADSAMVNDRMQRATSRHRKPRARK